MTAQGIGQGMATATNSIGLFVEAVRAVKAGAAMTPRAKDDKEYFAQDWIIDRLNAIGMPFVQQGRNSYPDFWAGHPALVEGYEVKSLSFNTGKPARKDFDCNSTIPSGRKNNRDVFLAFFLYTGSGADPRLVHTLAIAHADLINADHAVADAHENVPIPQFGSYADGFIRDRKMYVFPHPLTIYPAGIGKCSLIVPETWGLQDPRIKKVTNITRTVAKDATDSYTIQLHGTGRVVVNRKPYANAGQNLEFDVFEVV